MCDSCLHPPLSNGKVGDKVRARGWVLGVRRPTGTIVKLNEHPAGVPYFVKWTSPRRVGVQASWMARHEVDAVTTNGGA